MKGVCSISGLLFYSIKNGIQQVFWINFLRKLINSKTGQIFSLHEPHPDNILKNYQIKEAIEILTNQQNG